MSEADTCDAYAAAQEAGVHYDTFRKNWRRWADPADPLYVAFPPPFRFPPQNPDGTRRRGTYAWRRSAIADWKRGRERALVREGPPGRRADGDRPTAARAADAAARRDPTIHRQRAQLAQLMETAR